jgi:hypothetical protein
MWKSAVALVVAGVALVTAPASAAPGHTQFMLVSQDGSFSALAPLCEKGHDVEVERRLTRGLLTGLHRFDCDAGEGGISAHTWLLAGDPSWGYEEGAWQIVAGTGAFEGLRGKGTYIRAFLEDGSGSVDIWQGVVDFDDVPPQVAVGRIVVAEPTRAGGAHVVRVSFRAHDASGGPVSYLVAARSGVLLAASYGVARSGTTSVALRVRPRSGERSLRVAIEATDQVGNVRTVVRALSVRGAS